MVVITFGATEKVAMRCSHLDYRDWLTHLRPRSVSGTTVKPYYEPSLRTLKFGLLFRLMPYTFLMLKNNGKGFYILTAINYKRNLNTIILNCQDKFLTKFNSVLGLFKNCCGKHGKNSYIFDKIGKD